jgi:hypothetical protein
MQVLAWARAAGAVSRGAALPVERATILDFEQEGISG